MNSMRYPAHPSYEDSGIASCPMRPVHWSTTRLKFLSELNPSKSQVQHWDPLTAVTFLPMEAIGENGELDVTQKRALQEVRNGYTFLGEGDVCIAKITPCFENGKGAIISGTTNGIAFATTEVIPFRCKRSEDAHFLYYLLTSAPFKLDAEASMYGAGGQKRVADSFAGDYSAVLPPPAERSKIAKFLDYETAKIDALIEKQQQLIALLKEKRQAVISHAVTKGLNPDAPMCDSGVEWLGEVPGHWVTVHIKRLISTRKGAPFKSTDFGDEGVQVVRASDIKNLRIKSSGVFLPISFVNSHSRAVLQAGELILSTVGSGPQVRNSAVGQIGRVPEEFDGTLLNQNTVVFRVMDDRLSEDFLFHLVQVDGYRDHLDLHAHGTANQASLNVSDMLNFTVPLPPQDEQLEIVEFVTRIGLRIDGLEQAVTAQVALLQERRAALISAAVTGKIDVRDWKAPESETETKVA